MIARDAVAFLKLPTAQTDEDASLPQIVIVQNWFEELRQRVPVP